MNYLLVVPTHGDCAPLKSCLISFATMVEPAPLSVAVVADGWDTVIIATRLSKCSPLDDTWAYLEDHAGSPPRGFCVNTGKAWDIAVCGPEFRDGYDYIFYLEHDFVFTRPVNLAALAMVLDATPMLAQMALMRDAVNEKEKAAGGLVQSRPGEYASRAGWVPRAGNRKPPGLVNWLEHVSYFTTNPSLMRRKFMAENPWPDYPEQCEGKFGIDLVARGYTFGVWGSGEPWVEHTGERTGFGY